MTYFQFLWLGNIPFIGFGAPWLIPEFGYCEESLTEHNYAGISLV
jgi:hypothetical protein